MINACEAMWVVQLVFYFKICSSLALMLQAAASFRVGAPACTILWANFISMSVDMLTSHLIPKQT